MTTPGPTLTTARLTLRPLDEADLDAYATLRFHPDVLPWLAAPPGGGPMEASARILADYATGWRDHGRAPFGVFETASGGHGPMVGYCGLRWLADLGRTDIVWTMHPATQGKGYAPEAARAALDWGFRTLGLDRIGALIRPDNVRSQGVARKIGLALTETLIRPYGERGWWDGRRESWKSAG